jgi:hypothetical protein
MQLMELQKFTLTFLKQPCKYLDFAANDFILILVLNHFMN